jgi:hypothetical protein
VETVSSLGDVQAASKNAISKTRTPVSTACLITDRNLCAGHVRCNQRQGTLATDSPYSLNDQPLNSEVPRAHSLGAGSIGRTWEVGCSSRHAWFSRFSDDPFLFRRRASGKQARDYQSNHSGQGDTFFHGSERTNCRAGCNSGRLRSIENQSCQEKILRGKRSSRLVLYGRQLGRA